MEQPEIDELIAAADRRAVYINQVEHAKERFRSLNILTWEGHIFELNQGFLSYVNIIYMEWMLKRVRQAEGKGINVPFEPVILLDKNEEPVAIENMEEFVESLQERHQEALNEYYDIYSKLQAAKNTTDIIEVY